MKEGDHELTANMRMQGYRNPFNGNVSIEFVDNVPLRNSLQEFGHFLKFPIKLSPSETEKEFQKMSRKEAEELWSELDPEDGSTLT